MTTPSIERVAIVGVGLLGGSLGLALRERGLARHVTGIGRNKERLDQARRWGAVTEICHLDEVWPDTISFLVLAAPVEQIGSLLQRYQSKIPMDTVVTDVGSAKSRLVKACEEILGQERHFVGSHPIAGSHNTGVSNADSELFQDRICVVTPTSNTDPQSKDKVIALWKSLGASVIEMSPEEHDSLVARTSHLPHMTAAALCALFGDSFDSRARELIGSGFRDTTRIAGGESAMWTEICQHNRDEITAALSELIEELQTLKESLDNENYQAVTDFLDRARANRELLYGDK